MKSEIIHKVTEEEEEKKREDHNEDDDDNEKEEEEEEVVGGDKYQKCLNGCLRLSFLFSSSISFCLVFFLDASLYFYNWVFLLVLSSIS